MQQALLRLRPEGSGSPNSMDGILESGFELLPQPTEIVRCDVCLATLLERYCPTVVEFGPFVGLGDGIARAERLRSVCDLKVPVYYHNGAGQSTQIIVSAALNGKFEPLDDYEDYAHIPECRHYRRNYTAYDVPEMKGV